MRKRWRWKSGPDRKPICKTVSFGLRIVFHDRASLSDSNASALPCPGLKCSHEHCPLPRAGSHSTAQGDVRGSMCKAGYAEMNALGSNRAKLVEEIFPTSWSRTTQHCWSIKDWWRVRRSRINSGTYVSAALTTLTSAGHDFLDETGQHPSTSKGLAHSTMTIFISHSSRAAYLA